MLASGEISPAFAMFVDCERRAAAYILTSIRLD